MQAMRYSYPKTLATVTPGVEAKARQKGELYFSGPRWSCPTRGGRGGWPEGRAAPWVGCPVVQRHTGVRGPPRPPTYIPPNHPQGPRDTRPFKWEAPKGL